MDQSPETGKIHYKPCSFSVLSSKVLAHRASSTASATREGDLGGIHHGFACVLAELTGRRNFSGSCEGNVIKLAHRASSTASATCEGNVIELARRASSAASATCEGHLGSIHHGFAGVLAELTSRRGLSGSRECNGIELTHRASATASTTGKGCLRQGRRIKTLELHDLSAYRA